MKKVLLLILLLQGGWLFGQETRDSVKVYFRQGHSRLESSFKGNQTALDRILERLQHDNVNPSLRLLKVRVVGGASPEGSIRLNQRLSEKRANALFNYLNRKAQLPDSLRQHLFLGRDWKGLYELVQKDEYVPFRSKVLAYLQEVVENMENQSKTSVDPLHGLQRLEGGKPYAYLYKNLFPKLRASYLYLQYAHHLAPLTRMEAAFEPVALPALLAQNREEAPESVNPFYMAIKTNLLYDLAAVPNIGIEFYLGKDWSLSGNWMYAWWHTDREHWYWRTYGGEIALRKWFGQKAQEKPLTGHHIGIYGQLITYDFETGDRGYLGDRWSYGGGIEYGYSHPIGRRLNLDFVIGVGYFGGEYKEYIPQDDCYVWQATKDRNWVGPTKAEVSLVWLIGRGNYNKGKGGRK